MTVFFIIMIIYFFMFIINSKLQNKFLESDNKILKILDFLVSFPFITLCYIYYIILVILPMFTIYIVTYYVLNIMLIPDLSTYLSLLIVFYIIAYKSYYLMIFSIKLFSRTCGFIFSFVNYKSIDIISNIHLRKWIYLASIILYISSKVILFYKIDISTFKHLYLIINVIGEVILTFLYIDTYISNFKPDILRKNEDKLSNLKYEYFNKFKEDLKIK